MYARILDGKRPDEPETVNNHFSTSPEERIEELKREIATRKRVYPQWIIDGKIDADIASLRLRCLEDTLKDLYDQKYTGAPVHKQNQLALFETPSPITKTNSI
jgi:hypothetical protein